MSFGHILHFSVKYPSNNQGKYILFLLENNKNSGKTQEKGKYKTVVNPVLSHKDINLLSVSVTLI